MTEDGYNAAYKHGTITERAAIVVMVVEFEADRLRMKTVAENDGDLVEAEVLEGQAIAARMIKRRILARGEHARPEPQACGECEYDPTHLWHDCADNAPPEPT